jgi:hypothetical protein
MDVFLADAFACEPSRLAETMQASTESLRARAYRDIERRRDPEIWRRIIERTDPFQKHFTQTSTAEASTLAAELQSFLLSKPILRTAAASTEAGQPRNATNQLQRAMQVALASGQRRELPIDEGSWERLEAAVEIAIPAMMHLLRNGRNYDEPLIATKLPKSRTEFRLKALHCPEALTLQQYILNELLQEHALAPAFAKAIPAVRYAVGQNGSRPWTTGGARDKREPETVAFAYQIDTDVLEGRVAPRREGMFRPYRLCWREFIRAIDVRAAACQAPLLYVARLDIRRFYDSLRRSAVIDALLNNLRDAFSALAESSHENDAAVCARLFQRLKRSLRECVCLRSKHNFAPKR